MFKIKTVLTYRGIAAVKKKDVKTAVRAEMIVLGLFWHEKYLPLHFEPSAYTRYGGIYVRRSHKYDRRKGHSRPMVNTGQLLRAATRMAEVRASGKSVRIAMRNLTGAVNLWGGKREGPNFKEELTAVAGAELQTFATRLDAGIHRRLAATPTVITKQIA